MKQQTPPTTTTATTLDALPQPADTISNPSSSTTNPYPNPIPNQISFIFSISHLQPQWILLQFPLSSYQEEDLEVGIPKNEAKKISTTTPLIDYVPCNSSAINLGETLCCHINSCWGLSTYSYLSMQCPLIICHIIMPPKIWALSFRIHDNVRS